MATCRWAILCDYAFLDAGGKMCLIGIFDNIFARNVPVLHHQAALVIQLLGDPGEHVQLKVEIVRPTGAQLTRIEGQAIIGPGGGGGVQLGLANFQLPDFGYYSVNIYIQDELATAIRFGVTTPPVKAS